MKRMFRRQRRLYVFAVVVGTVAIINVLFLFILYRPTRAEYSELRDSITRLKSETQNRTIQVAQKQKIISQLQSSNEARQALYTDHLVPMDAGFAQLYPDFDKFARDNNVRWNRVESGRVDSPNYGLYAVRMKSTVQGQYPDVVRFIKDLEDSDTFYIINSVDLRTGGDSTTQSGMLSLALELETYFYQ